MHVNIESRKSSHGSINTRARTGLGSDGERSKAWLNEWLSAPVQLGGVKGGVKEERLCTSPDSHVAILTDHCISLFQMVSLGKEASPCSYLVSFTGQWSQVNRGLSCSLSITSVTYTDPSVSSPDSREMSGSNGREGICGSQTLWLTPIFFGAILEVLIWFSILGTQ